MNTLLFAGGGTGGHLYPALALAAALREERQDLRLHFVGARRGVEARVLPARGEEHTLLPFEPLRRDRVWQNWRLGPALVRSVFGLTALFRRLQPRIVIGTGGYASGPAGAWAVLRRVPLVVQEQNSYPGLTTRWLSRWARQVHLGFPEAALRIRPGRRTEVHVPGNPIQPPDPTLDRGRCRARFELTARGVVVLVVGGSQGAAAVNRVLTGALKSVAAGRLERPAGMQILWATGPTHLTSIQPVVAELGLEQWVRVEGYIDDMPAALAAANLALSRAGAMATAEMLAWGVPALLVPLPTSAAQHQRHNAEALAAAGAAVCMLESELTPESLWSELVGLVRDEARRSEMAGRARARARPDAAREIARSILKLLED